VRKGNSNGHNSGFGCPFQAIFFLNPRIFSISTQPNYRKVVWASRFLKKRLLVVLMRVFTRFSRNNRVSTRFSRNKTASNVPPLRCERYASSVRTLRLFGTPLWCESTRFSRFKRGMNAFFQIKRRRTFRLFGANGPPLRSERYASVVRTVRLFGANVPPLWCERYASR